MGQKKSKHFKGTLDFKNLMSTSKAMQYKFDIPYDIPINFLQTEDFQEYTC